MCMGDTRLKEAYGGESRPVKNYDNCSKKSTSHFKSGRNHSLSRDQDVEDMQSKALMN